MTLVLPTAASPPAIEPGVVTRHFGVVQAVNTTTNTVTVLVDGVLLSNVPVAEGYSPKASDVALLDVVGTGQAAQSYVVAVGRLASSLTSQVALEFVAGLTTSELPGSAASDGTASSPARADHLHGNGTGQLLGVTRYSPAADPATAISNGSLVALDTTNLTITVTVPASGKVLFRLIGAIGWSAASHNAFYAVFKHSSTQVGDTTPVVLGGVVSGLASVGVADIYATGLTPGSQQFDWYAAADAAGATFHAHSNVGYNDNYGPALMEAWAA